MSQIVWLASYPKSGNTWLRAFLANFLYPSDEGADINSLPLWMSTGDRGIFEQTVGLESSDLTHDEIDLYRPDFYRRLAAASTETLYIKTHDAYLLNSAGEAQMPADVSRGVIYIVRNPMDVAVSFAHHLARPLDEAIASMADRDFAFGPDTHRLHHSLRQRMLSWSDHVSSWLDQKALPVHLMRYEDMRERPLETFTECVRFLGLESTASLLRNALERSSFDSLRRQELETGFRERPASTAVFFRSGKVGQWKSVLRQDQITRIAGNHRPVMERLGYMATNKL